MPKDPIDFFIARFRRLMTQKQESLPAYFNPRPYRNAAVRFRPSRMADFSERRKILEACGLNAFLFPAQKIPGCDFLSDSGTTTMTMEQWSELLLGDEAYGSNEGFFALKEQIAETFGEAFRQTDPTRENLFIFHQGRAAEHALFMNLSNMLHGRGFRSKGPDSILSQNLSPGLTQRIETYIGSKPCGRKPFYIIPSNAHFDTTEANIANNCLLPLNLPCEEHLESVRIDSGKCFPFRGNIDLSALENLLENERDRVPLVYITVTNNTGGGQPVSMANIEKAAKIAHRHEVPLLLDACRFAENAWFIRKKEEGYEKKSIPAIVHEMFSHADGFHISLKKDGLVNMGGALAVKADGLFVEKFPELPGRLIDHQILTEGHPSYGGLAGRDLKAIVCGLATVVTPAYLDARIGQVDRFGKKLQSLGIPIISPVGGHAVYIDMDGFFSGVAAPDDDFKGIAFTALLLLAGHRFCELGLYAFGRYAAGREFPPDPRVNFVRAAVPRLAYEEQDLFAAAEAVRILHEHRDRIPGVSVTHGRDLSLRHFKSRFRFKK